MTASQGPLSVYIHIPFCTVKCGYCDFNAYAGLDSLHDSYRDAVIAELAASGAALDGYTVATIAFGGGTPGEMPPADIAAIIAAVYDAVPVADGAEVSLEANPGTSDACGLAALHRAGVTRISFGAQSFDADELRFLDRIHSPEAIGATVRLARAARFASINLDLIYGLPGQELASWRRTLEQAIALQTDHLSCYALTVEDGTPLARRVEHGEILPASPDTVADHYELATSLLAAGGFRQYEISNWARPGHQSRHNRVYWTDGDYLGIGAGAHGYMAGERYENAAHPRLYIDRVRSAAPENPRPAMVNAYRPDDATAMFDWLTLRLRLLEGFDPADFERRFGRSVDSVVGPVFDDCEAAGVIQRDGLIRLTSRGRLLHGELSVRLLAHLRP
jgi:oxygen-independent coproporphyrinogen III oxidase